MCYIEDPCALSHRFPLFSVGSDLLSGIFLRRTQQEVLSKILPPRVDVIIRFPLSERHAQIYDTMVETVIDRYNISYCMKSSIYEKSLSLSLCSLQDGTNATNNRVLPALLSLRKVCCTGDVTVSGASEAMGNFKQASSIYKGSSNIDATISHKLLVSVGSLVIESSHRFSLLRYWKGSFIISTLNIPMIRL